MKAIERLGMELATLAVVALALLITANVAGRELFGLSVPDSVILVRELMIAAVMLPLGMATAKRAHIAVTFLADRASPRWQGRLIVLGTLVALIALMPLIYAGGREALHALRTGAFYDGLLNLPRWPSRVVFLLGLVVMWLRLALMLAADLRELRATGTVRDVPHHDEGV